MALEFFELIIATLSVLANLMSTIDIIYSK